MKRMRDELSQVEDAAVARVLAEALVEASGVQDVTQAEADAVAGAYEAVLRGMTCHRVTGRKPDRDLLFGPSIDKVDEPADPRFDTLLAVRKADAGWLVYLRSMDGAENQLACAIAKLNIERAKPWPVDFEADYLASFKLSPDKKPVLEAFGRRRLTILTGGPGTGKTRTICAMLTIAQRKEVGDLGRDQIAILAPTHRARLRIRQELLESGHPDLLGLEPQTVHAFLRDSRDGSQARLVVVDEASMVDLVVFQRLLDSLHEEAALVIVGDPDQLPSVDVGSVLADLALSTSLKPALCDLTEGHRFSATSKIAKVALAVHDNRPLDVPVEPATQPNDIVARLLAGAANPYRELVQGAVDAAKLPLEARLEAMRGPLNAFGRLRLLCSHRVGPVGSQALSRLIMRELNVADVRADGAVIMVTRNDLDLGITNGETGIVSGGVAYFQNGDSVRAFGLAQLPEYVPAFATTVHAAQGSQFAEVVVVLGKTERSQFVTREMVYTAVTRAQEKVTIFAAEGAVEAALGVRAARASGLQYRLA